MRGQWKGPIAPPPPRPVAPLPPRYHRIAPPRGGLGIGGAILAAAAYSVTNHIVDSALNDAANRVRNDITNASSRVNGYNNNNVSGTSKAYPSVCEHCGAGTKGGKYCEYCGSSLY